MIRFVISLFILLAPVYTSRANDRLTKLWDEANTAYVNGNYDLALKSYDSIIAAGQAGYKLYYNLGNTYFRKNNIGKSILYYNKALLLAPNDSDIRHNLELVNTFVKDNIEPVPVFFLKRWVITVRQCLSSNAWAWLSIGLLTLSLAAVLLFLLAKKVGIRKLGFFTGAVALFLFITAVCFSVSRKKELNDSPEAIVMSSSAPVKNSPDSMGKDFFIIHEGTKVRILGSLNDWYEIQIADGNKGWILSSYIERIN